MGKIVRRILILGLVAFVAAFIFTWVSNVVIIDDSEEFIYQGENRFNEVPEAQAALVLGARVWPSGNMSSIFMDRANVAWQLYTEGKVQKILISGDHGRQGYDEVNTAKDFLLNKGIPKEDIFLDHAGFDTYDSLYRARDIFEAESLIICTQEFHLPRAVYIGKALGLNVYGVSTDLQLYVGETRRNIREMLARGKAMADILFDSKPKFLGPAIPLSGDSSLSWD